MKDKIYVESGKRHLIDDTAISIFTHSHLDIERECAELGLFYSEDDMDNVYISETEDCGCFEEWGEIL